MQLFLLQSIKFETQKEELRFFSQQISYDL
jgi:hypothetical protein